MEATAVQGSKKMAMRKCRKEFEDERMTGKNYSAFLPDHLLLEILRKVPTDVLRFKARFVCKRWFNIATNMILLDHASFIVQESNGSHLARHLVIREEEQGPKMEVHHLDIPYIGRIKSWCNEFLLITDPNRKESLYVFNLITKEGRHLPGCSTSCGGHYTRRCGVALSFDGFKGVYKALHVFMGPPIQCKIIVFKRDITSRAGSKWKKIEVPSYVGEGQYYWGDPVPVQSRYFHWNFHSPKYLVSMDMVREKFFQTPLPGFNEGRRNVRYSIIEMSGSLTLLDNVNWDQCNLWILKDPQRMRWERLQSITIPSHLGLVIYPPVKVLPFPIVGVMSKRYLIFRKPGSKSGLFSFDLKTKLVKEFDIEVGGSERCVTHSSAPSYL